MKSPEDFNKYWEYPSDNTANPYGYHIYPYAPGSPIDVQPYIPPTYIEPFPYNPQEFVAPLTWNTNNTINPFLALEGKKVQLIFQDNTEIEGIVIKTPPNLVLTDNWLLLETKFSKNHYFNKSLIKSFYIIDDE